jgi:hypothetical protein
MEWPASSGRTISTNASGGRAARENILHPLLVELGSAHNLLGIVAVDPVRSQRTSAFAAAADISSVQGVHRSFLRGELGPSAARVHFEDSDISSAQQLQRGLDAPGLVELGALGAKFLEPSGKNKVRYQSVADLVAILIAFAGIADLVGVEYAVGGVVLHEDGQIDVGVGEHFDQFMTGGDRPTGAIFQVAGGEDLSYRKTVGREIVVAERARLIGIVQYGEPSACGWRWSAGRNKRKLGVYPPDGTKIFGDLLLKSFHHGVNLGIGQHRAGVNH